MNIFAMIKPEIEKSSEILLSTYPYIRRIPRQNMAINSVVYARIMIGIAQTRSASEKVHPRLYICHSRNMEDP